MGSWILVFSLLFLQQPVHTEVKVDLHNYSGFKTEQACDTAGEILVKNHKDIALEPSDDYDSDEHHGKEQADKDKFELIRPSFSCINLGN